MNLRPNILIKRVYLVMYSEDLLCYDSMQVCNACFIFCLFIANFMQKRTFCQLQRKIMQKMRQVKVQRLVLKSIVLANTECDIKTFVLIC